jgi:hypothetical protein
MRDLGVADDPVSAGGGQPLLAETLGLAMARRAAEILDRHRGDLTANLPDSGCPGSGAMAPEAAEDGGAGTICEADAEFEADNAIFTAVLDAANECLGSYDTRPADDRWCDALLQLLSLARLSSGGTHR